MNPAELARSFLVDLIKLPLIFQLGLVWMAGAAIWQWRKKRKLAEMVEQSTTWPVYRARVVWAQVSDRKREGKNGPSYFEGLLTYSYTVPGHELEVGEHRKRFFNEEEADGWACGLREQFVDVGVDPADSRRSVWQETPYVPSPAVPPVRAFDIQPSGLMGFATLIVFCTATVGALVASWIQLSCVLGKPTITPEKNQGLFFGMHIGAIVCAVLGGLVTRPRSGDWARSFRNSLELGSVSAKLMKVLFAYYTVVFLYGWVRMAAHDGAPGGWVVLMFSAGWLLFYLTSALACWHTMQGKGERISQGW